MWGAAALPWRPRARADSSLGPARSLCQCLSVRWDRRPEPPAPQPSPVALRGHRTAATSPAGVSFHTTVPKLSSSQISWGSAQGPEVVGGAGYGKGDREWAAGSRRPRPFQNIYCPKAEPFPAKLSPKPTQLLRAPLPRARQGDGRDDTHQGIAGRYTADTHPGGPDRLLPRRRDRSRHVPVAVCHPHT